MILDSITLVCVTSTSLEASLKALKHSSKKIKFKRVLLISNTVPGSLNKYDGIEFIHIETKFNNTNEWGRFIIFDLYKFIDTDFICLIHDDGFIVNPNSWSNKFLNFDFIGAPWPLPNLKNDRYFRDDDNNLIRVGNSVSLRSKRLLELPTKLGLKWEDPYGFYHEDGFLCVQKRKILKENNIKFADFETALYFSREKTLPQNRHIKPFAFHKWSGMNIFYPCFNKKYQLKKLIKKIF